MNPDEIQGRRFEIVSGSIHMQGKEGVVVRVEPRLDRPGKIVIHTLNGQTGVWRTQWSWFREHAVLKE